MDMLSIGEAARRFDVTPRMLRHYEKLGLLAPSRRADSAYRFYDEDAVRRLQQIVILRKLRIPLKQIAAILGDENRAETLAILRENVAEIDDELGSLEAIKRILEEFIRRIDRSRRLRLPFDILKQHEIMVLADALILPKQNLQEKENFSMEDFSKIGESRTNLRIRIVRLPPMTVAAAHFVGDDPETRSQELLEKFVRESGLYERKPDSRMFGFNHPNPSPEREHYGYEVWASIPDDFDVPAPLEKKRFDGGLYAALTIDSGNFHEWQLLDDWVRTNELYEGCDHPLGAEVMFGGLEEHLNWVWAAYHGHPADEPAQQIDLLQPIRKKKQQI